MRLTCAVTTRCYVRAASTLQIGAFLLGGAGSSERRACSLTSRDSALVRLTRMRRRLVPSAQRA